MNTLQHALAFVVQLRTDCILSGEQLTGRIEHVSSGRTSNFHTREELIDVLDRMVKEVRVDVKRLNVAPKELQSDHSN